MNGIEIIILVTVSFAVAALVGTYLTRDYKSLKELTKDYYVNEEKEGEELAEVTEQVESMKKVVEAYDTLIEEINRIAPVTTSTIEEVKKETKSESPIENQNKKRKYYPKKKKQEDK